MIVFRAEAREDSGRLGSGKDCALLRDLSVAEFIVVFVLSKCHKN